MTLIYENNMCTFISTRPWTTLIYVIMCDRWPPWSPDQWDGTSATCRTIWKSGCIVTRKSSRRPPQIHGRTRLRNPDILTIMVCAEIWWRLIWVTTREAWLNSSRLLRWKTYRPAQRWRARKLYLFDGWVRRRNPILETIMDVPCVIIHYLPTIVCGNGRTQEEIGHVSHSRVSSTRLPDKACGITFREWIGRRLLVQRNVHDTMLSNMIILFVMPMLL